MERGSNGPPNLRGMLFDSLWCYSRRDLESTPPHTGGDRSGVGGIHCPTCGNQWLTIENRPV